VFNRALRHQALPSQKPLQLGIKPQLTLTSESSSKGLAVGIFASVSSRTGLSANEGFSTSEGPQPSLKHSKPPPPSSSRQPLQGRPTLFAQQLLRSLRVSHRPRVRRKLRHPQLPKGQEASPHQLVLKEALPRRSITCQAEARDYGGFDDSYLN
jgi:hypothetical protein